MHLDAAHTTFLGKRRKHRGRASLKTPADPCCCKQLGLTAKPCLAPLRCEALLVLHILHLGNSLLGRLPAELRGLLLGQALFQLPQLRLVVDAGVQASPRRGLLVIELEFHSKFQIIYRQTKVYPYMIQ